MQADPGFLDLVLGNPYDPEVVSKLRRLEGVPTDAPSWNSWWKGLTQAERDDEGAKIAVILGIGADEGGRKGPLAQNLLKGISDECKDVARRAAAVKKALDGLTGDSDAMRKVRQDCWAACFGESLAAVSSMEALFRTTPVLIQGETGTGKELVAEALRQSGRAKSAAVHLAALPPDLVQSELFGHEKGSFSGALATRQGVLERCHKGVVFLDEIGELPAAAQVALLLALQEGVVRRVGGNDDVKAAPRVVSATHRNLDELVQRGTFRLDLLHRLSSVVIEIPPLRERREDIPFLIENELQHFGLGAAIVLRDRCEFFLDRHASYDWPGNVRELYAVVRTLALGLVPRLKRRPKAEPSINVPAGLADATWTLDHAQRWYCQRVVAEQPTQQRAAEILGIDRGTLRRHLAESDR